MGKTIVRVLIILLAAALVGGLIYLGVSSGVIGAAGGPGSGMEHMDRPEGGPPDRVSSGSGDFHRDFERGGHDQVNVLAGLGGIVRNLGIIAMITAAELTVQKGLRFFARSWKKPPASAS